MARPKIEPFPEYQPRGGAPMLRSWTSRKAVSVEWGDGSLRACTGGFARAVNREAMGAGAAGDLRAPPPAVRREERHAVHRQRRQRLHALRAARRPGAKRWRWCGSTSPRRSARRARRRRRARETKRHAYETKLLRAAGNAQIDWEWREASADIFGIISSLV